MEIRWHIHALQELIQLLQRDGYEVVAPVRRDQSIVYETIQNIQELPRGWVDEQSPGKFSLRKEGDSFFAFTLGHDSWKRELHPPKQKVFASELVKGKLQITPPPRQRRKKAFLGVRSCELKAIEVQDQVFTESHDDGYASRRENLLLIAVQCVRASAACFCVSQNTGPQAKKGFDLALTEVQNDDDHYFLVEAGSAAGKKILKKISGKAASATDLAKGEAARTRAAQQQKKLAPPLELKEALRESMQSATWDTIAQKCLSCANCTMVCPTCFCTTVEDVTDLSGDHAERWRKWDSCFHTDFSYMHGGAVRSTTKSKYRQWMTHKLSTWFDQFSTSGCVGCGRCTTWCPVGIDFVAEANQFHAEWKTTKAEEKT